MLPAHVRLGLSPDADPREIRKAYARELKKINQEKDPAAFQALREAYEHTQRSAEQNVQVMEPKLEPNTEPGLAQAAWELCLQAQKSDAPAWEVALRHALDGEMLVNLNTRLIFESIVANAVVYRRYSRHESLFIAATSIFGWEDDRRRLLSLNRAGVVLDHAITQRRALSGLTPQEQAPLLAALARMANPRPPELEDVDQHCIAIYRLQQLFPALVAIAVGNATFHRWLNAGADEELYTPSEDEDKQSDSLDLSRRRIERRFWLFLLTLMVVVPLLLYWYSVYFNIFPPQP